MKRVRSTAAAHRGIVALVFASLTGSAMAVEPVAVPAAPADGGPRHFEVTGVRDGLNLRDQPSLDASVLETLPPGTLLDNLGCRRAAGRAWCDVQRLGGGRRGWTAAEFLSPAVGPDGAIASGYDDTALRAGEGDYDATGRLPCAALRGQPMRDCPFGVARAPGGAATVVVTKPDGVTRTIFFSLGRAIGADTSEAGGYGEFDVEREGDITRLRIGDERYEIPDAVVLGG